MSHLTAGVARADITPPCGLPHGCWAARTGLAEGIHDAMTAQALVLDDGRTTIAIVAVDLVFAGADLTAAVRERVQELTGMPPHAVLVNAAHNHSAPSLSRGSSVAGLRDAPAFERYTELLPETIAGAVYAAWRSRGPARAGAGTGRAAGVTVNRVVHERPVDDAVGVIAVDRADGTPLAVVASFACHATLMGGHTLLWNADEFPGPLRRPSPVPPRRRPASSWRLRRRRRGWDYWFRQLRGVAPSYERRDGLGERWRPAVAETPESSREPPRRDAPRQRAAQAATAPDPVHARRDRGRIGDLDAARDAGLPGGVGRVGAPPRPRRSSSRHYQRSALGMCADMVRRADVPVRQSCRRSRSGTRRSSPTRSSSSASRARDRSRSPFARRPSLGYTNGYAACARRGPRPRRRRHARRHPRPGRLPLGLRHHEHQRRPRGGRTAGRCQRRAAQGPRRRVVKITAVEAHVCNARMRNWVFVRVVTDEPGLHGWGEATLEWHTRAIVGAVEDLADLIVGEDPTRIEHLWQMMFRQHFWHGNDIVRGTAMSGIDIALWDILGKVHGVPCHKLWAARCGPIASGTSGRQVEDLRAEAQRFRRARGGR
jgi:hypothetical protein